MNASLGKMLQEVEWGEYRIGDLFEKIKTKKLPYKADELPKHPTGKYVLPCLTSSFQNQGLNYFAPKEGATVLKNVITIPSNSDIYRAYFQSREFTVLSDAYAIRWKEREMRITQEQYLFMVMCINKITDLSIYSYKNKLGGWNVVRDKYIQLPIKNGQINFPFMEKFIAELEAERVAELSAYLKVSGLDNYELSSEEENAIDTYGTMEFAEFCYAALFDNIKQGRRLKKDDQQSGSIPFVMSGTTNTGVVNYISNPVALFPKNSITLDIFGNAFYRDYNFGAGDDTGVYWNSKENYSEKAMLFLTSAMERSVSGKYSYGKKLRSSQSHNIKMILPTKNGKPDFKYMETLISAVQKLVIKDVIKYTDEKIEATKACIEK